MDRIYNQDSNQYLRTQESQNTNVITRNNQTKKKNRRRRPNDNSQRIRHRWTKQETETYCCFIQEHEETLMQEFKKDKQGIYNLMEDYMNKSRTKLKCKSHHHKMMKRYKTIPEIVKNLRPDLLDKKKSTPKCKAGRNDLSNKKQPKFNIPEPETPSESYSNFFNQNYGRQTRLGQGEFEGENESYIDEEIEEYKRFPYEMNSDSEFQYFYEESQI